MPYAPTTWLDGVTTLGPTNLNKLELGTRDAYTQAHGHFNVKDAAYGAKGDGVTDDQPAIQAAIAACVAAGGGVVYLPPGTYMLGTYLTITGPNVTIWAPSGATLKLRSGYVSGAQGQGHIFAHSQSHITLDGITFDGNNGVVPFDPANNFAVWVWDCSYVTIRNCTATALNSGGSNANGAFNFVGLAHYGQAINNRIYNCNGGGIFFQGADCVAIGNQLAVIDDVGIVFNSTNCVRGVATGNTIDLIPAQAAFGVENGASQFCITGNTIRACFAALDLNDAGYAGPQNVGGIFADNLIKDLDKGVSVQTFTCGVLVRTLWMRDIKIANNLFSGLKPYGATDAFVFVNSSSTEGLEITGNTFEDVAQGVPAGIVFSTHPATHTRLVIRDNTFRSTSAATKMGKGIWLTTTVTLTDAKIERNLFQNIISNAVQFDASATITGIMRDNIADASVGALYGGSPWGNFASNGVCTPHLLCNTKGLSELWGTAPPTTGSWLVGDKVWNSNVSQGGSPGWVCIAAGSPGTWRAIDDDEIGYDQITASVNVVAAGAPGTTIIGGTSRTYDGNPVVLEFFSPQVTTPSAAAGNTVTIALFDGATQIVILGVIQTPAAANMKVPVLLRWRFTPSAGSHQYAIVAWTASTTGTPSVAAGTGGVNSGFQPAYLRITRA